MLMQMQTKQQERVGGTYRSGPAAGAERDTISRATHTRSPCRNGGVIVVDQDLFPWEFFLPVIELS